MTERQIARTLGISKTAVHESIHKSLRTLRSLPDVLALLAMALELDYLRSERRVVFHTPYSVNASDMEAFVGIHGDGQQKTAPDKVEEFAPVLSPYERYAAWCRQIGIRPGSEQDYELTNRKIYASGI